MNRLSVILRIYQRTRIRLLPLDGAVDADGVESLEAALRTLTQSSYGGSDGLGGRERDKIKTLLDDLIQCGNPMKARLGKEACRLAYGVGFYARCAELFHSCHSLSPQALPLSEIVINASANTANPEYLHKCLSCISPVNLHEPLSLSALHILRIYWQSTKCFVRLQRSCSSNGNETRDSEVLLEKVAETEKLKQLSQYLAVAKASHQMLQMPCNESFDEWWSKSRRLVTYHTVDNGEATVYEQHFLSWERYFSGKTFTWMAPSFLVGMMRSCTQAARWDLAERYARIAEVCILAVEAGTLDEILLQQYLLFMSLSMQSLRGINLMGRLRALRPDYVPSIGVVQAAARLAGNSREEDLAVWCLQALLNEKQSMPPSSQDIFLCLVSLAKCRAKNFHKLLHVLEESGLMKLTEEESFHLELQYSHHSLYWEGELGKRLESHLASVSANPDVAGLSVRNAALLLRILQESEHVTFMKYFRLYIKVYKSVPIREKGRWLEIALKWAASQTELPRKGYELLVNEVDIFLGLSTGKTGHTEIDPAFVKRLRVRLRNLQRFDMTSNGENLSSPLESNSNSVDHADINLARFLKQCHYLLPPCQPKVKGHSSSAETKLWKPSDTLAIIAEREWKVLMQNIR